VDTARVDPGTVTGTPGWGYALDRKRNAVARAVNRLLAAGEQVSWAGAGFDAGGRQMESGSVIVRNRGQETERRVLELARDLGLEVTALAREPSVRKHELTPVRVGIYKSWRANMDEGWTRWLLEQYEFQVDTLVDGQIRAGDLSSYQVIVLPDQAADEILNGHPPGSMPPQYVGGLGAEGVAALDRFIRGGGTLITLDNASDFAIQQFALPIRNEVAGLSTEEFFIPGSLVRMRVDASHPIASGMPEDAVAFFVRSRAFGLLEPTATQRSGNDPKPVDVIARYAANDLMVSGLESGGERIADKPAAVRVGLGQGSIVMFGFRSQFRAQPAGTFKLLFNAIHSGGAKTLPKAGATVLDR
jgi:hypothetical protein